MEISIIQLTFPNGDHVTTNWSPEIEKDLINKFSLNMVEEVKKIIFLYYQNACIDKGISDPFWNHFESQFLNIKKNLS